jgi:hypothetical protein
MNINGNLIRPYTLAKLAAQIGQDFATRNPETGGMDFDTEGAQEAWHEVYNTLIGIVGFNQADLMIAEAEYRA